MAPDSPDGSVLLDFLDQYLEDREAGGVEPLEHYLGRFPDHRDEVAMEYERLRDSERADKSAAPRIWARIGPYRLIRQLGRGGQGSVFLAEDTRIERRVALKVLTSLFDTVPVARLSRFRREAEVISRLEHPGICGVFEADLDGEVPYLAMRYVEGETLAARIASEPGEREGPTPLPTDRAQLDVALHFFEGIARALHTAHTQGVVHRDIKPGNLMVTPAGSPVILDFGLAHDAGSDVQTLTQSGELFGTPAYMSPEQVEGAGRTDVRTDVYSLGVVMYEFLTRKKPFEAGSRTALYQAIVAGSAPSAQAHNPELPVDVDVVLETALERDRDRRYASARELADDLRRIRRREPIHARPAGPWLRFKRWTQRHPVVATSALGSAALLTTGLVVSLIALREVAKKNTELETINLGARSLLTSENPTLALLMAVESAESGATYYGNMALLFALESCREQWTLSGHEEALTDIDVDAQSRRVVTSSFDGTAAVWDLATGELTNRLDGHAGGATCATFALAGRVVVTGGLDGTGRVHPLDGSEAVVLEGHTDWVRAVTASPDGSVVATTSNDGTARLWDAVSGACAQVISGHDGVVTVARFSPEGTRLLTASGDPSLRAQTTERVSDHTARIWDVRTGAEVALLAGHEGAVLDARFSSDGKHVATASADEAARIWDARTGELVRILEHGHRVFSVAWDPTGARLVTTHRGGAFLFDTGSWSAHPLVGHMARAVRSAAFSPDGSRVVTGSADLTARIWDVSDPEAIVEETVLARAAARITKCVWTPDGSRILTATDGSRAHVWHAERPPGIGLLEGHEAPVSWVDFDPTGERLLTASEDGTARVWSDLERGRTDLVLRGHTGGVRQADFSPDGTRIATASNDHTARLFDARNGEPLAVLRGHEGKVRGAQFDPTGQVLVTTSADHTARLWDGRTGALLHTLEGHTAPLLSCAFSPDGSLVATGARDLTVRVFEVATGASRWVFGGFESEGQDGVPALDFHPDGHLLAAACEDGFVRVWDMERGELHAIQEYQTPGLVTFTPDGRRLLVSHRWGGSAFLTDETLQAEGVRMGDVSKVAHDLMITAAEISPDGEVVLTASRDGSARVWSARTGEALSILDAGTTEVIYACFGPRGERIATASKDGSVRVWPVDPLEVALRRLPREMTASEQSLVKEHLAR